jgi:DNA-binding response OmpR family regulator
MAESRPTVRILVVDDAIEVCELASLILRRAGYETAAAATGAEALAAFGAFKPDLVLLDIVLPDVSGFEVCRRIRVLDAEGACPVVVMSSLASGFDKSTAFDAGAADYVEKPLDHDELLARVRAQLSLAAQRGEERRNARELERLVRERTAELGRRLEERTQLIKEIHHRVMNNLQVIRSLAVRQADAEGGEARRALLSIEARLGAMASVYRSIFDSSDDLSSIDGAVLLASIVHAAALSENAAEFTEDQMTTGSCVLTLTRAVPFALIAHELSTCAFRTGGRGGKGLRVSLEKADGMHVLRFALAAENRRPGRADCLDLATMLAPQLGGTLALAADAWTLRFPA